MPAELRDRASDEPLGLFQGYGVELEYMIVDAATLDVAPAADALLTAVAGELTDEHENGDVAWNNELALHVIELKCNGPRSSFSGLAEAFQANVAEANRLLAADGLKLMPSGMHPWMDPAGVVLWPHGSREIYEAFNRVFDCRGHGWANLQSAHLNLPFADDEEFGRLHAAVRVALPILPGLAASTPVVDGQVTGALDNRLIVYRGNCARIPSITGEVVPEPIFTIGEYQEQLLERLYRDIAPHEPEGVLRREWVNARGAIARFERMAIEIRVLDVQECPAMDVAYQRVIAAVLRALCEDRWCSQAELRAWDTRELAWLLGRVEHVAESAEIGRRAYLAAFGYPGSSAPLARLWEHLIDFAAAEGALDEPSGRALEHYLRHGSLATRIRAALGLVPTRAALARVYGQLCDALAAGVPFAAAPAR